jgi:hypothetical protein
MPNVPTSWILQLILLIFLSKTPTISLSFSQPPAPSEYAPRLGFITTGKLTAAIPREDVTYPVGHELFRAGNTLASEGFDHVVLVPMNSPASGWISRHVEILRYLVRSHDARITYREHSFHTVSIQHYDEIGDGPVVVGRNPELRLKAGGRAGLCARQVTHW